jgi:MoaA/NifB/PqqE/SkfB family radical SAM enzyme
MISKIKTSILDKAYNFVVFNYSTKKLAVWLLSQKVIVQNPVYVYFYRRIQSVQMEKHARLPRRVCIENTNLCSANCTFCPHSSMKRKKGVMDFELFKKIIGMCLKFDINFVSIHGFGEPLMDGEFFKKVKYAKDKGIKRVTTNTNAGFLNESSRDALLKSGLDEIFISFDSATRDSYEKIRPGLDFDLVEDNIKQLISVRNKAGKAKPLIFLSFIECKYNTGEVKDYIKKWRYWVDGISVTPMRIWPNYGDRSQQRIEVLKDPCRLIWTDIKICWDGRVALCCNDYEAEIIIGDLREDEMDRVWQDIPISKIRELHRNMKFDKIELCRDCEYNARYRGNWWIAK